MKTKLLMICLKSHCKQLVTMRLKTTSPFPALKLTQPKNVVLLMKKVTTQVL